MVDLTLNVLQVYEEDKHAANRLHLNHTERPGKGLRWCGNRFLTQSQCETRCCSQKNAPRIK